jgi:hypothetical protein
MVRQSNGKAFSPITNNASTGIRIQDLFTSGSPMSVPVIPPDNGQYFAIPPGGAITINTNGSFVRQSPLSSSLPLSHFGGYPPGSLRSRVLQLLHEMGHLTNTALGYAFKDIKVNGKMRRYLLRTAHPLLPYDGADNQKSLSEQNTDEVMRHCRDQINQLKE